MGRTRRRSSPTSCGRSAAAGCPTRRCRRWASRSGTLREADDPEVRLHLAVDADRTIEGFTSWMPVAEDGQVVGWTLDLMRRRDQGFRPVMEFMIGASAMRFKEEGYRFISLSAAPLAKAPDELGGNSDQQVLQKLLDFLGHDARAVLRVPVAVRVQAEVQARAPPDVPRCSRTRRRWPRSASPWPAPTCPTPGSWDWITDDVGHGRAAPRPRTPSEGVAA